MAIIIESPNDVYSIEHNKNIKLFLAGGISNCPDWQAEIIKDLKNIKNLSIYNPRRKDFPMDNVNAAESQITWEYNKLKESDIILFWFSKGSLNPIVLYELGKWGNSSHTCIIIGLDPEYERSQDVYYQTKLARINTPIVYSLKNSVKEIKKLIKKIPRETSEKN